MRKILIIITLFCFYTAGLFGQSIYTMANFASSGDTFYLTRAQTSITNFESGGENITWDFSSLTGVSQRRLVYRLPTQTGFSAAQWPYLYNVSNVNLSSTDEQTVAILGLQQTNPNDYFLKNNNYLRQKASSYTLVINNFPINIRNVYDNPDTLNKFPLEYNSTSSSKGAYTINVSGVYYHHAEINRKDTVKGWGTIITPYKTYSNALQSISTVIQIDSIAINNQPVITNDTVVYREIKWFDPAEKNPVLYLKQTKTGNIYTTTYVEYLDVQQYYQPAALFAYIPVSPKMADTVTFQNLSTNASAFIWDFGDGSASNAINPQHIFPFAGTYAVRLIAYNGSLSDTITINVKVNPVNQTYTFTGNGNWNDAANWNNNTIPPSPLPATNSIIINHLQGGKCILNVPFTIESGASLIVNTGMNLEVQGNLRIQQ
jgi:PKD domain